MPRFGSKETNSLRKMELVSGRNNGEGFRFSMENIIGDPFTLATLGIATVRRGIPLLHTEPSTDEL